jgi:aromatic ring-opening dioxygenase LigB subunit
MTIVFAAIAPHGGLVFDQPEGETRRGMDKLARQFAAARPEAVIIATPHGTLLDDRFGVVRAARLSEHASRFVEDGRLYEGPGDPDLADACLGALRQDGLPVAGVTFGATAAGDSEMPIDWGAGIPLSFLRAPAVVVTPCRALPNELHVRVGAVLAHATGDRRIAFVASADHGHGHSADGPYGFSEHSAPYDEAIVRLVRGNGLGDLVDWDPQIAVTALADSFWQLLMLHGAIGDGFEPELLSYEAPTYFGMLTASYSRQD